VEAKASIQVGPASQKISANQPRLAEAAEADQGWMEAALSLICCWRGVLEGELAPKPLGGWYPHGAALSVGQRRGDGVEGRVRRRGLDDVGGVSDQVGVRECTRVSKLPITY
jgi:hypothetical protein